MRHIGARCAAAIAVAVVGSVSMPVHAGPAMRTAGHHAPVRVIHTERLGPRVVELTIRTPAFATPTKVDVDLPAGYRFHPHRRWPATYFLAGIMNTYASLNSVVNGVKLTKHFPAIAVSPNGDSGWWSDWYNGGAFGSPQYETYVIDQLIPLIDKRFRTIPARSQRAVVGVSMGGYGAMMLAAQHPDLFGEAASLSGAVDTNFEPIAAVLTASPTFQGGAADAIYGPQASEEVRWHGHNPTDLAANLRGLDLQLRSANGTPDPAIGENLLSPDSASCVIEAGVYQGSIDLDQKLNALHIPHLWKDYGPGCHTVPNFEREISATLQRLKTQFANPPHKPRSFNYASIEPRFRVYGWRLRADSHRALEFLHLRHVRRSGLTLVGSGRTTVTTPAIFRSAERIRLHGAIQKSVRADVNGRITFTVDLGAADRTQQYTAGSTTTFTHRTVTFWKGSDHL